MRGDEDRKTEIKTAAGRHEFCDWIEFFSEFSRIVLVANSDTAEPEDLPDDVRDSTLFVYFNRVNRVLDTPTSDNTLLVTRSNQAGSELVYRGILSEMTALLQKPGFRGIMNLRAVAFEHLQSESELGPSPAGTLDLAAYLRPLYPQDHTASTGFALALWLSEHVRNVEISLTGFTGLRSARWKVFHIHDWVFEQSVLQVLKTHKRLTFGGPAEADPYAALRRHFPEIEENDIILASIQVLSAQSEGTKKQVDQLFSITSPLRAFYNTFKRLKPKTRKQRLLAARANST
ncbi:hypothetical protein C8J36_101411 [Rhizobium sp. PP-F2F-G48]|uniref:3-deoxy-manno-octulosonate cytidylyltransferase n=1 Tax=Rhizobium sp. PP-F2F-G48 TaxID=2135651 RepID=UPI0010520ED4|nr:3-deoxy-manno-octulosonate cytidylyltransferase [Rhizobium sp. PP-F2F-G48]TCM58508.1 hypothetical protein C8J36_101411 [Rhizobium sp. PP-F2F-G48]